MTLTKCEKISLSYTEIAKRIRKALKEIPGVKFSVTKDSYSGGASINISLMTSNFRVIRQFEDIPSKVIDWQERESELNNCRDNQNKKHHSINQYRLGGDYDPDKNDGLFLTEDGYNLFKKVVEIANYFNFDHSDSQVDYFNVNFYLYLNIGKYDKEYKFIE